MLFRPILISSTAAFALVSAQAQDTTPTPVEERAVADLETPVDNQANAGGAETSDGEDAVNLDEVADQLNSQQQLKQTFTLQRTIDGEVVESEKRTVIYDRSIPYRDTEAGQSALESLKAAFDQELLTRTEAFTEAKLDFVIADVNRDEKMTLEEFSGLVESWRETENQSAGFVSKDEARRRQYEAFLAELDAEASGAAQIPPAEAKFRFMAGVSDFVSREDYIREYLLDFDSMDKNKDTLLKGDELMRFRALNRGETIEM